MLCAVGVVLAAACIDMSAPKGVASISVLQLPSLSVVLGDSMRDSNGVVVPLTVLAFDGAGNPIGDAPAQFFFTDTTTAARLTAQNLLVGDKIGTVHIVGQVGNLQTPAVDVPVTFAPVSIVRTATKTDTALFTFPADSLASLGVSPVATRVLAANDSGSNKIIVRYKIVYAPATRTGAPLPAVFLTDDNGRPASTDTTDATGAVSRKLVVLPTSLADPSLINGSRIDSAIVELSASYKGKLLQNAPLRVIVRIVAK